MFETLFPFALLGAGAYLAWRTHDFRKKGVAVDIVVVKQSVDWGQNTTINPVFEVVSGEHAGKQAKSGFATSFGFHGNKNILSGLFHPKSEKIESLTILSISSFIAWALILGSLVNIYFDFIVPLMPA